MGYLPRRASSGRRSNSVIDTELAGPVVLAFVDIVYPMRGRGLHSSSCSSRSIDIGKVQGTQASAQYTRSRKDVESDISDF
jgi:hypothetical protein